MPAKIRLARQQALRLCEQNRVTGAPVPVEAFAHDLGVLIQYAPLIGDLSGMACITDGVAIIGINSRHPLPRRRFTLAHELGHIQLHRRRLEEEIHVDKATLRHELQSDSDDESEANAFAAELLMPQAVLRNSLRPNATDLEDETFISALARKFTVTVVAMRFRLQMPNM